MSARLPQGKPKKLVQASVTMEMEASDNPTLESSAPDPTLFCTGFKKNRFYLFSRWVTVRPPGQLLNYCFPSGWLVPILSFRHDCFTVESV